MFCFKSPDYSLGCCSGTGQVIPPFVIFDAKNLNHLWTGGELSGNRYGLSDSGWTNGELFLGWLQEHFLAHAVPSRPLLLLVDGHSSHYDPDSIRLARDHSVIIFCLPPHTTHEAQPLDVSFFGALKKSWSSVCHDFIQASQGKAITRFNFSQLFSKAWLKTCLPEIICNGFERAGIIPFNPEVLLKRCPGNEGTVEIRRKTINYQDDSESIDIDKSESSSPCVENSNSEPPSFSPEKEDLYQHRFEEGYDLHDDEYSLWLRVNHPEALVEESSITEFFPDTPVLTPLDNHISDNVVSLSSSGCPPSNGSLGSALSTPSGNSGQAPESLSGDKSFQNTDYCTAGISPHDDSGPVIVSHTLPCERSDRSTGSDTRVTPNRSTSQSPTLKRSPLASITNLLPGNTPKSSRTIVSRHLDSIAPVKIANTGKAKVLTSAKCLKMLDKKKQKKDQAVMEKKERKRERERKKFEREEIAKKKKEEKLEKKRMREEAALKKTAKSGGKKCNTRNTAINLSRPSEESVDAQLALSSTSSTSTPTTSLRGGQDSRNGFWECTFCYEEICQDGKEWLQCACDRWVHEQCLEEIILDDQGQERFCPYCLNKSQL